MMKVLRQFLHRQRYRERYAMLEVLLDSQRLSPEYSAERHASALAGALRHAVRHVPYYRRVIQPDAPLVDWPILTKDLIRQHREALVQDGFDRTQLKTLHTGGSTGAPLAFDYDPRKHEWMRAGMMRSYTASGWQPGEPILNFWGARQDQKPPSLKQRWANFIAAEQTLPTWSFQESDLDAWVKQIQRQRPVLLQGYASVLATLARFVLETRVVLPASIKGVYSTAEVLYDTQRQAMQTAFGSRVFNQYGSREVPNIACECAHGQMHVFNDLVHLESVGPEHQLLVTSLINRVFPFIRYQNGDTGQLRPAGCACGSPFPILDMGVCRSNDIVTTPTGHRIYPSWFVHLLDGMAVRQFQFVQESPVHVRLDLIASEAFPDPVTQWLHDQVRDTLGMTLSLRYCEDIPKTDAGKHRFVIAL